MSMTSYDTNVTEALIALGANIPSKHGDVASTLERAVAAVAKIDGVELLRQSRWFRTPAWPVGSGPDFINGAIAIGTTLTCAEILHKLVGIEVELGRTRPARWAPRACDLDLLAFGDEVLPDVATVREWMALDPQEARHKTPETLILPHPRLHERSFVIVPLQDVAPSWKHPVLRLKVDEMFRNLPEAERAGVVPVS